MNNWNLQNIKNLIGKTLIDKKIPDDFLMQKWEEQAKINNGSYHLYYHLFYRIAKELQPEIVVELGGWRGLAAAHFASGNPDSTVITLDHHSDPGDDENRKMMLEMCGKYYNINYIRGWSTPEYVEEYNKGRNAFNDVLQILGSNKISCLFIDSWHEGRYLLRDWEYYQPLLDDNALVIVDDIFDSELFIGMIDAWNSLPGKEKFTDNTMHSGIPMGFLKYEY